MPSIAEATTTIQMDAALFAATKRAKAAYADETCRIERGLQIALDGGVTLFADGSASIQSQSDPSVRYHCNGHCSCKDAAVAPHGRCKHAWSKSLYKWAKKYVEQHPKDEYYATATMPDGTRLQGIATWTDRGWLFVDDAGFVPFYIAIQALELGGNIAIAEAQREKDGDLVRKVCGY